MFFVAHSELVNIEIHSVLDARTYDTLPGSHGASVVDAVEREEGCCAIGKQDLFLKASLVASCIPHSNGYTPSFQ